VFQYMQGVEPANSRHNIVPGQTEAKDEAIRKQLHVGKLKLHERLPGEGEAFGDAGQPARLSTGSGRPSFAPFRGRHEAESDGFSADESVSGRWPRIPEKEGSRGIPQILSDQASGLSGVSSVLGSVQPKAVTFAKGPEGRGEPRRSSAGLKRQDHTISKKPSAYGLGHIRQARDYKPHDHVAVEDSPEAKQHDGYFNEQANALSKGLKFISTFKEPEPEEPRAFDPTVVEPGAAAGEEAGATGTSHSLEGLIYELQAATRHAEGYFVYLRQNPENPRNPYDLVPFDLAELGLDPEPLGQRQDTPGRGQRAGLPEEASDAEEGQSRAARNLHVVADYKRNAARQILGHRKAPEPEHQRTARAAAQSEARGAPLKYYTLSKQGMTTFLNGEPVEFVRIENWLAERAQFSQISQKKFFSNFRTWKILRMWRLNILSARRELVTASLKAKLFTADPVFGKILLQHRATCKDLEKLRVLDLQQVSRDPFGHVDFQQRQMLVRELVENAIREASDKTRDLFKGGINQILDALRARIHAQEELDQDQEASAVRVDGQAADNKGAHGAANEFRLMRQIEKLDKGKSLNQDPVYEQLGFKHNLKFSARNELRDACKKFLRFAFLLDFVALESLSAIFLQSIQDTVEKIRAQVDAEVDLELDHNKDGLPGALPPQPVA
jgi:hypothetical protein